MYAAIDFRSRHELDRAGLRRDRRQEQQMRLAAASVPKQDLTLLGLLKIKEFHAAFVAPCVANAVLRVRKGGRDEREVFVVRMGLFPKSKFGKTRRRLADATVRLDRRLQDSSP